MSRQRDLRFTQHMVENRVKQALRRKEVAFARLHAQDDDEALLDYVRAAARRYPYSPHVSEVVGGTYIATRFGSWNGALNAAGLPDTTRKPVYNRMAIVKAERNRQWQLQVQRKKRKNKEAEEKPE